MVMAEALKRNQVNIERFHLSLRGSDSMVVSQSHPVASR
jgi:hypothetical protein